MLLVTGSVVVPLVGMQALRGATGTAFNPLYFSDARLWTLFAFQVVVACVWLPRLHRRGWTMQVMTQSYQWWDIPRGVALLLGAYVAAVVATLLVRLLSMPMAARMDDLHPAGSVSWLALMGALLLNPVFEESLYLGYLANALRRSGWTGALFVSVAVRVLVHLYQGPLAFVFILPLGVLFSIYYLRTGRLWPVVVAHIVMDALPLARLAHGII